METIKLIIFLSSKSSYDQKEYASPWLININKFQKYFCPRNNATFMSKIKINHNILIIIVLSKNSLVTKKSALEKLVFFTCYHIISMCGFQSFPKCYIILLMGKHKQSQQSEDYSECESEEKVQIRKPKIERLDKFKNLKKIVINISMTQYPVVSEVAESLGWKLQQSNEAGDWDVYWTDFAIDPDVLIKMHLFQKINHYPGIHVIARKNLLGNNLMALRNRFPEQYNFFPLTWMLPSQYAQFRAYYQSKPKGKARTYIAKPQADCQGRGIFLTRKIQDLQNGKHYVVQRYLARPYLIQGLKFDLRIYVLLCGSNPLRLYMYQQGLARLATEQYTEPTTANLQRQYIHLTNYAINKNNPKFIFNNSSNNMGIGHKRSITSVLKLLATQGVNVEELKAKINDVAIKTILCGLPHMSHQYKCSQPEDYSGSMCFHILGLDIMLNNKAEPILLEVNHTPSFTTDTPLDHKIKFNLIKDSLKIMNINTQTKNQLFNKAKQLNKDRLITGKRQIFDGKERESAVAEAQVLRDQYQDNNIGGFQKIFPTKNQQRMEKYNNIIETANKAYLEESCSIRIRMLEKQAKRLAKQDYKQMKKSKLEQKQKQLEKSKQIVRVQFHSEYGTASNKIVKGTVSNLDPHKTQKQFQQLEIDENEQSNDEAQNLTRSQNNIDHKQGFSMQGSDIFIPNLGKKYSEKQIQQASTNPSSNGVKKHKKQLNNFADHSSQLEQALLRQRGKSKEDSIARKVERSKHTEAFSSQKQRIKSNTLGKANSRGQNLPIRKELPNIIDSPSIYQISHKREDRILTKNSIRVINNRSGKIGDNVGRDIKDLVDKRTGNSGNFLMPKIISLNLQNQRRALENPIGNFLPFRKGNVFRHNQ